VQLAKEETVAKLDIMKINEAVTACAEALCGCTYSTLRFLLNNPYFAYEDIIYRRSVRALCSLFCGCPRLMILAQTEARIIA
jgi:hypothetical protein